MNNNKLKLLYIRNKNKTILFFLLKIGLTVFFIFGILNIINIISISIGKEILYEDSFYLLPEKDLSFIKWLFIPHNGHPIIFLRLIDSLLYNFIEPFAGYNILFSGIIILIGVAIIYLYLNLLIDQQNIKNITFLSSSILWISPWQWENLIWEFQVPWFLISLLVISLSLVQILHYKNIYKNRYFNILSNGYIFLSPILASISSGQGICYVFLILIAGLNNYKIKKSALLGVVSSLLIVAAIRIFNDVKEVTLLSFTPIKTSLHFMMLFFSIIKAPISAFNPESTISWIIPIVSSILFIITAIYYCIRIKIIRNFNLSLLISNGSILPAIFALSFGIITSISRSSFGIEQAVVSRYLTCTLLFPIGLLWILSTLINVDYNEKEIINKRSIANSIFINKSLININIIFLLLLLLNSRSYFLTINESNIALINRIENYNLFNKVCKVKISDKSNNKILKVKEIHERFVNVPGLNIPPYRGAEDFNVFNKMLTNKICKRILD